MRRVRSAGLTLALALVAGLAGVSWSPDVQAIQLGKPQDGSVLAGATLNVSEIFYYKYNLFLDDDTGDDRPPPYAFHEFVNRTTADLRMGRFKLGVQLDIAGVTPGCSDEGFASQFASDYGAGATCVPPNKLLGDGWDANAPEAVLVQIEKIYARYNDRIVSLQLGDFYASFGRGIVLSMVKKPEIDQDTSLLGGRFDLKTKPFDLTVLAGLSNPQEISMELRNRGIDKQDGSVIAGASITARPWKPLVVTAHGVGYDLAEVPHFAIGGTAAINGIGDVLDLFFEGDGFFYGSEDGVEASVERGYSLYGTATLFAGPVTLLVEAKRYKDAMHLRRPGPVVPIQYTNPPTLEHEPSITEDINGSLQSNDITGVRLQPELYFFSTTTTLTGSLGIAVDDEPHPPFSVQREITVHPWIGIDQPIHTEKVDFHIQGDFGYRHDFPLRLADDSDWNADERSEVEGQFLRDTGMLHFKIDLGMTAGKHAFELVSTYRRHSFTLEEEECWTLPSGEPYCDSDDGWVAFENALSYTFNGRYTAAVHLDFTDDPIVQSIPNGGAVGNLSYDHGWRSSVFIGGEIIARPIDNLELYAFFGSQKSGVVCTGGACRTVPAFTGVKTRVTVSF